MFCPKCGVQNPETGKFCRSCGTDLGNVSQALTGNLTRHAPLVDRKGKPISWDGAIMKAFTGLAFLVVSIVLALSGSGRNWWFWLLIPAFTSLGAGAAQFFQLRRADRGLLPAHTPVVAPVDNALPGGGEAALPPSRMEYAAPESRFTTGDLVPPSVTDSTTRHLEINSEGETMALPKRDA
jgi:hypothetical protein